MHDWKIPKDVGNPYLREGVKVSPRNATTKKKSLKKKKNPAKNPQKWCLCKAWMMRKKMV